MSSVHIDPMLFGRNTMNRRPRIKHFTPDLAIRINPTTF
jgi:hypothetical protein